MGVIRVDGQIVAGPPNGVAPSQDRSVLSTALALKGGAGSKPFQVATGFLQLTISNSSYQTLPGIGTAPAVTHADTLYFFSGSPILVRLTTDDGAGGDVLSVIPVDGLVILEFNAQRFLKLLEVLGAAPIEYFASGNS